ncbi:MAG: LrgB family protein [Betaproteobacteria bacterium]|nr:LrgB family protein [Betaproteobacteria bacterium]MCL2885302.1 LrgB family protein [Betaproteobacteria bacterium]
MTLGAFALAQVAARLCRGHPLANPLLLAIIFIGVVLVAAGIPYADYFAGAKFLHFLLGPATVALAVPLARHTPALRKDLFRIGAGILVGMTVATASTLALAWLFGGDATMLRSLAAKSATTPIAIGITERLGGLPSLAVAAVMVTGIGGAILGIPLLRRMRIEDPRIVGIALGVSAHGIGTARALQFDIKAGAYAALGMAVTGALLAVILPLCFWLYPRLAALV